MDIKDMLFAYLFPTYPDVLNNNPIFNRYIY
jgi:hypothetical protein